MVGMYPRKVVRKMQMHGQCVPRRCFKGAFGKYLPYCKYGFPFKMPQLTEELHEDGVCFVYVRRLSLPSKFSCLRMSHF